MFQKKKKKLNFCEIKADINNLMQKLSHSMTSCYMCFQKTQLINKVSINGKVLKHGICSNGIYLFLLTKERALYVYFIYEGSFDKLVKIINFDQSWTLNDSTILFCSQKTLYLIVNKQAYQFSICNLSKNSNIVFKKNNCKEFEHIDFACSNGVSYSKKLKHFHPKMNFAFSIKK